MKQHRILILSNCQGSGLKDDVLLKEAFEADGHQAALKTVFFEEAEDENWDIFIRRNTWVSKTEDTAALYHQNQKLIQRLTAKQKKTVNLIGLDGAGKGYLCDLFAQGYAVIPTVNTRSKLDLLPDCDTYVVKDIKSFGNGLHQKFVSKEQLGNTEYYREGDIIQPKLAFTSEIQCYYVGTQSVYTLEYTPSKYPNYPEPSFITLSESEQAQADLFATWSGLKHGFQRIDFLRLTDGTLAMMEIEDHAAFMNLQRLPEPLLADVLHLYKENIYDCLNSESGVS